MVQPRIVGFKYLRPGQEVAVVRRNLFGRGEQYQICTIKEVDALAGVVHLNGNWRMFGLDGVERGPTGGEPRQRLLAPIPDEIRRVVWRQESKARIAQLLSHWSTVDDNLIQALLEAIGGEGDTATDTATAGAASDDAAGDRQKDTAP